MRRYILLVLIIIVSCAKQQIPEADNTENNIMADIPNKSENPRPAKSTDFSKPEISKREPNEHLSNINNKSTNNNIEFVKGTSRGTFKNVYDVSKSVFQLLLNDNNSGTAFLYETKSGCAIITAHHNVFGYENNQQKITLIDYSGKRINVSKVYVPSSISDIALLSTPVNMDGFSCLESKSLSNENKFTSVYTLSYGYLHQDYQHSMFLSEGVFQFRSNSELILTLNPVNIGSSGAPILTKDGLNVVGIISRIISTEDKVNRGVTSAIPIEVVDKFILRDDL